MQLRRLFLPLLLMLSVNAAWADSDGHDDDATKVRIVMGEMYFQVDGGAKGTPLRLQTGKRYELVFQNSGQMKHEALLGRGVIVRDGRPRDYQEHLLGSTEVDIEVETMVNGQKRDIEIEAAGIKELELEPGTELTLSFTLPAQAKGEWELGCFIAGHYEAGMRLDLLVE
ncbi:MAG TPA: hypothetical protein VFY81_07560 [Gammaproteobacteria bacterium]|nr:hypothetical protein [Gammaproteobacteria bacterium]